MQLPAQRLIARRPNLLEAMTCIAGMPCSVYTPSLYLLSGLLSLRGSPTEKNPFLDSQNILLKAQEWGIKVWSLDSEYLK